MASHQLQHHAYTVGWVCALPKEQTAATAMLDEIHLNLPKPPTDLNTYTLGSIGGHNIVIACLPKGRIGTNFAATVATHMISTFPDIRFSLMVGIGGGVSRKVRLGDVVVGVPSGTFPGVVQWDMGKAEQGHFKRTGSLNSPPGLLLSAVSKLETAHELYGSQVPRILDEMAARFPRLAPKYQRSDKLVDTLFKASYSHKRKADQMAESKNADSENDEMENCRHCDVSRSIKRKAREMMVHYGSIASGNQVIKNAAVRDQLSKDLGDDILCVEMEAAGLVGNFQCIVIRGICDYADSHKNREWQEHAAGAAAAFAKELLGFVEPADVKEERTMKDVLDQVSTVQRDTTHTLAIVNSARELEILNWLTATEYGPQHSEYLQKRHPGTGQWLLTSSEYQTWRSTSSKTLFCPGIPGAGKTILTSVVIEDLKSKVRDDPNAAICYVYCNFNRKEEQKIENLISKHKTPLPAAVTKLHLDHVQQTRPTFEELTKALQDVTTQFSMVYLVVDALDEYQISDATRNQFLSILFGLQAKHPVNLFATSRFIPDIVERFKGASTKMEIRAAHKDIESYIRSQISQPGNFSADVDALRTEIVKCVTERAAGMFLLAQLHIESLKVEDTTKKVRNMLVEMASPTESTKEAYVDAYEATMRRIEGQHHATRALQVLGWITCARRQLSKVELQHALGVAHGSDAMNPEDLPKVEHLVSVCAGLVTADEGTGVIRLVHYTAQEYFESTMGRWFPNIQTEITRTCISYLSYQAFHTGHCLLLKKYYQRAANHPFLEYAGTYWGLHAHKAQRDDAVLKFLMDKPLLDAAYQAFRCTAGYKLRFLWTGEYTEYTEYTETPGAAHHAAARFGLEEELRQLLNEHDMNEKNCNGNTPLLLSCRYRHWGVARLLIREGADVNAENGDEETPLMWAGYNAATARLLIDRGARTDCASLGGITALSFAVHDFELTKLIIKKGVEINVEPEDKSKDPLRAAIHATADIRTIELLIEHGADLHDQDDFGDTPLDEALVKDYTEAAKLIIEHDNEVGFHDNLGDSTLFKAIDHSQRNRWDLTLIELMIDKGAEVTDLEYETNKSSLVHLLSYENYSKKAAKLLIEAGADVDGSDNNGNTPLIHASRANDLEIATLLINHGAYVNIVNNFGWGPLSIAQFEGNHDMVRLLVDRGADYNHHLYWYGLTHLHVAARVGELELVRFLINDGAEVNVQATKRKTPLHDAVYFGQLEITKYLVNHGADIDAQTTQGKTPLYYAIRSMELEIAEYLVNHGADINVQSVKGESPLSLTQKSNIGKMVRLFDNHGSNKAAKGMHA
ncbi:serine/threonine-protein kinase ripk4 [Apiospora arundinis]